MQLSDAVTAGVMAFGFMVVLAIVTLAEHATGFGM